MTIIYTIIQNFQVSPFEVFSLLFARLLDVLQKSAMSSAESSAAGSFISDDGSDASDFEIVKPLTKSKPSAKVFVLALELTTPI